MTANEPSVADRIRRELFYCGRGELVPLAIYLGRAEFFSLVRLVETLYAGFRTEPDGSHTFDGIPLYRVQVESHQFVATRCEKTHPEDVLPP